MTHDSRRIPATPQPAPHPSASPRAEGSTRTPSGRTVAWAEWGDPGGPVVLFLHRSPGSRRFDPDSDATAAAGVRLVTVDRPGYGGTDPVAEPGHEVVADDVLAVVDDLGLDDLALVGWSGGGEFAIRPAARLGRRLHSLSLVTTPAPDDAVPWWPDPVRPLVGLARADPAAALATLVPAFGPMVEPAAAAAADPTEADSRLRARPGVLEALTAMATEAARQGATGAATDAVAGMREAVPPLAAVEAPVHLWYGESDWIGPEHGRWYAASAPGAKLRVVPDTGHLLPLLTWGDILAAARA